MNSKELKAKFIEKGLSDEAASELSDYVMKNNGIDINRAKENSNDELTTIKAELEKYKADNEALKGQVSSFSDYAELKKFKEDSLIAEENNHKIAFLKSVGLKDEKYAKLLLNDMDFTKGVYDAEKNTYTGMDDIVKSLKENYADMFQAQEKMHNPQPNSSTSASEEKYGWEKILEARANGNY